MIYFGQAVGLGQRAVAENWLLKGARPKSRNLHGHPAVTLAARSGELTVLTWLHRHLGLSVRARSDDGRSVAAIAAWHGHLHVVKYVFEADRQATEAAAAAAATSTGAASGSSSAAGTAAADAAKAMISGKGGEAKEEIEGLVVKRNAAEITMTPVRSTEAAAVQPPLSPPSPPSVLNPVLDCQDSNAVPFVPASLTNDHQRHHQNGSARALFSERAARDKPMGKRARWRLRHRLSQTQDYQIGEQPALLPPSPERDAISLTATTIAPSSPPRSPSTSNQSARRKLELAPCSPNQMEGKMAISSHTVDEGVQEIGTDEGYLPDKGAVVDDASAVYDAADSSSSNGNIENEATTNANNGDPAATAAAPACINNKEQEQAAGEESVRVAAAAKAQAALARAMQELEAARALDWDAVEAVAKSRGETRILKWLQMASKTKGR